MAVRGRWRSSPTGPSLPDHREKEAPAWRHRPTGPTSRLPARSRRRPEPAEPSRRASSRARVWGVSAAVLAVLGVVLIALAVTRGPDLPAPAAVSSPTSTTSSPPASTPSSSASTRTAASPSSTAPPPVRALPPSNPTRVVIPSIGVNASVVSLGLTSTGALQVPTGPTPLGWFTGSPTPGSDGPAVLAGHVTYNGARGVFFKLSSLKVGDTVQVARGDGRTAVFTVTSVASYSKDTFPTGLVYGHTDGPELRLITCAGDYDPTKHYYPDNLVVDAKLTSTTA